MMTEELSSWEWSRKSGQDSKRKENIVARDISLQLHSHPQIEIDPSHQKKEKMQTDRVLTCLLKIAS
jgi:hypothetical protein